MSPTQAPPIVPPFLSAPMGRQVLRDNLAATGAGQQAPLGIYTGVEMQAARTRGVLTDVHDAWKVATGESGCV